MYLAHFNTKNEIIFFCKNMILAGNNCFTCYNFLLKVAPFEDEAVHKTAKLVA